MEHLIVKYLNNQLKQEEWEELREWLEKNDLNKTALNNIQSFHSNINSEIDVLEDQVWEELQAKRNVTITPHSAKRPVLTYLKVAAVFLIMSAVALIAYQAFFQSGWENQPIAVNMIKKETPLGQKITTRLPDGSIVTLNAGSQISFPENFTGETREVNLSGEAFFEVEHNPAKPFYVRMNGDRVRVLGTSFNIRSYPEDNAVYVSVATGRVSYSIPSGEEVILEPDQMAVYFPAAGSLSTRQVDPLQSFGWKDKIIYFKSTRFEHVITELERWYGVKITVQGNFKGLGPFTGDFRNESLEYVLKGLSYVYPFDFQIDGDNVTLNKIANQK